jgi:hypothetical protein
MKTTRLTETDINRLVKKVIREDRERFTPSSFTHDNEGATGTFRVENGSLILEQSGDQMEYAITCD